MQEQQLIISWLISGRGIGDDVTLYEDCLAEELLELIPQQSSTVLKIEELEKPQEMRHRFGLD